MNYIGNWTLTELYNLPVGLRNWFVERTIKQKESEREAIKSKPKVYIKINNLNY